MLTHRPITRAQARRFTAEHHRHCGELRINRFSIGAYAEGRLVGIVTVGQPTAQALAADPEAAEIARLCVAPDAPRNACSYLYGVARRAWQAMGGVKLHTYTLESESGASLRGAGFRPVATVRAKRWSHPSRPRPARAIEAERKIRWEAGP